MRRREFIGLLGGAATWPTAGLAQQPQSNGYAIGGGARLYFVRAGEGPLMLFVYGHRDGVAPVEPTGHSAADPTAAQHCPNSSDTLLSTLWMRGGVLGTP